MQLLSVDLFSNIASERVTEDIEDLQMGPVWALPQLAYPFEITEGRIGVQSPGAGLTWQIQLRNELLWNIADKNGCSSHICQR